MRPRRKGASARERGLTLVELLMVVAIVGVLAAVVAANMTRPNNEAAARSLAHKVWVALRSARAIASNVGSVVRITFTDQTNSTLVTMVRSDQVGPDPTSGVWLTVSTFESPGGAKVRCVTNTTDAVVDKSADGSCIVNRTLEFRPDGTSGDVASPAGATVYVQDVNATYQHKVYVYRLTGFSRHVTRW